MRKTTLPAGALLAALCFSPLPANAATFTVDCDAGNTITAALNSVKPGDTVLVSGMCKEQVSVAPEMARITLDGPLGTLAGAKGAKDFDKSCVDRTM